MPDSSHVVARLYAGTPGLVRRRGRTYPVAVLPLGAGSGSDDRVTVGLTGADAAPDGRLARPGRAHLDALQARTQVHDGAVLCLDDVRTDATGTRVQVRRGSYFDMLATCDAVGAELAAAGPDAGWPDLPLRRLAHDLAGDPVTSGRGRTAAFGVSVLLVVRPQPSAAASGPGAVVVGRRSLRVATSPGRWHVAPSGMLEEAADGRHVATTVATELREELGVVRSVDEVEAGLRVVGLVTDLARLRPDLVVVLDLDRPGAGGRPDAASLAPGEEFDVLDLVPLTRGGLSAFWAAGRTPRRSHPARSSTCSTSSR